MIVKCMKADLEIQDVCLAGKNKLYLMKLILTESFTNLHRLDTAEFSHCQQHVRWKKIVQTTTEG